MAITLVTYREAADWAESKGFGTIRDLYDPPKPGFGPYLVTEKAAFRTQLAKYVAPIMAAGGGLFLLLETDVWPSLSLPLIYKMLVAPNSDMGPEEFVGRATGFTYGADDVALLESAIAVSLFLYWGFLCVSEQPRTWLRVNNDDILVGGGVSGVFEWPDIVEREIMKPLKDPIWRIKPK